MIKSKQLVVIRVSLSLLVGVVFVGCGNDLPKDKKQVMSADESPSSSYQGWLSWRGPDQNGVSGETGLPDKIEESAALWKYAIQGGGTPVIANGRAFIFGFYGETQDVQEALVCLDADTGELIWEKRFSDYLSDIIYNRYAIGAPLVDEETGNIYLMSSAGLAMAYNQEGKLLWEHSMLEEFGRLTFPNGRTGTAVIDGDRVIFRGITAAWGRQGPARDRFYAFDKRNGDLIWISTPGGQPIDSSYSTPVFHDLEDGRRVFYSGTGCGNMICADARTGEALWRFQVSTGGVNASPVLYGKDKLIVIHGKENLDSSLIGRLICLKIPTSVAEMGQTPVVLGADAELWRNEEGMRSFTSSPVVHDGVIYTTVATGELMAVDAKTGERLWSEKLAPDQIHASPLYAEGKIYAPMFDGSFHVLKVSKEQAEILSETQLDAPCIAAPSVWGGRLYLQSKKSVYCFGPAEVKPGLVASYMRKDPEPGPIQRLQVVPYEFRMKPGDTQSFKVRGLDNLGLLVEKEISGGEWKKFIPPAAKVKAEVDAVLQGDGTLIAPNDAKQSAGALKVVQDNAEGVTRGRILSNVHYSEDFESFELSQDGGDEKFAYPPLSWLAARLKWRIIDTPEGKIAGNTLDKLLFQRSRIFIGDPDMSGYNLQADVMTDGNRRIMSDIGLINQRYIINLVGNWKALEVSSNHDRLKVTVPFAWKSNEWYTLKTRVNVDADGMGMIRGKVWKRGETEPEAWTIEVEHKNAHKKGAPGIFAFSPQAKKRVFIDNILLSPNE
ncbi:MAG: PQQ-binding-like beta-propeller repeat protein [Verrucomicrobiota bacterium]